MPVKYILGSNDKIDFTAITKLNQGAGSGLDSDLLDGLQGSAYEQVANKGVASGYASLNASSLVVQNPASKGQANGLAELDASGKIPSAQLPLLALTNIWTVASQAAQLALIAQEGDIAIRTDLNKSFAHNSGTAGTMADWSELLTPTDAVLSVFGRTGAVAAATNDYTWAQINKVVSSLADIATKSHTVLSDIGTNTHAQIDTHLGASSGIHGITGSVVGTSDAQTLTGKILSLANIKDEAVTPVGNILLKVLSQKLKIRNAGDTADIGLERAFLDFGSGLVNADIAALAGIVESKLALNFATHSNANDPAASEKAALAGTNGIPSGTNKYLTNSDPRNSDARTPAGTAGGDLAGTYPNPTVALLAITDGKVATANKDGLVGTPCLRTLGTGAQQACAGNDSRLADSRTPTAHATTHARGGSDIALASRFYSGLDASKPGTGNTEPDIWWATDTDKLYVWDGAAWKEIGAGGGAVSSVFGRTGAVAAATNDYTWAQINKVVSSLADIATKSHTVLSDIGTNTHAQIDTHLGASSGVHGITSSVVGTTDTQTLLNKLFGSTTIMKEQGVADAITTGYSSHELHFRNSMWYLGAEVKRVYKIRNDILDPVNNWYQLTILQENNTLYALKHQGSSAYIDYYALTGGEIYNNFNVSGGGGFQFNVRPSASYLTSYKPLYLYGDNLERIRLEASGTTITGDITISGLVTLTGGYFFPSNIASLPTADSTYRGKMIRVQGGTGVLDIFYICRKKADDTYEWAILDISPDKQAALAGTDGTPSSTNKYVTNSDARLNPGEGHITILPWFYNSITSGSWSLISTGSGVTNQLLGDWALRESANLSQVDYKVYLAPGTYTFSLITVKNTDRGIIDVLIDGTSVGTMDSYAATIIFNAKLSLTGITVSTGGLKTLSIKINGKNASSSNYMVDLFCMAIWRTA